MTIKIPVTTIEEHPLKKGDVIESNSPQWGDFYNTLLRDYRVVGACYFSERIEDILLTSRNTYRVECIDIYVGKTYAFVSSHCSREDVVFIVTKR